MKFRCGVSAQSEMTQVDPNIGSIAVRTTIDISWLGASFRREPNAIELREVMAVPGAVIAYGGGGPHCITQQVPADPG